MSWSWSHTSEAYENVRRQIESQPREWLETVWSEWVAAVPDERFGINFHADLDLRKYELALVRAKRKTDEQLAEFIWNKTESLATCTNGGHEAHCCPFGCGCHFVPFDAPAEVDA